MARSMIRQHPKHIGVSPWSALLPLRPTPQILEGNITSDVVIIGAGFAGLSAARRLHQLDPKLSITILDAEPVAEGSAGRNSGFMIDLPHELTSSDYAGDHGDKEMIALNRQAIKFAKNMVEEFDIPSGYFAQIGKINGASSRKADAHNHSYAKHLTSMNEPSEMLDELDMLKLTGSRHYRSGLYTAGTTLLQPSGYILGIAQGLRELGVSIFENSPVLEFERINDSWCTKTPKGQVTAKTIILAVNGHLESFGFAKNQLMQVFLFGSMSEEISNDDLARLGGADHWGITPSDPMGTSMHRIGNPQGGNRIITRTCSVLRSSLKAKPHDMARAAKIMRAKFETRFPQLSNLKTAHTWSGHLCLSWNGVSVAKELDDNVFSACVQNGLGTTRGTLTGIAAAEKMIGQTSDITRFFDQEPAPKKLVPEPFRGIGANAYMRFKEWQAGDE